MRRVVKMDVVSCFLAHVYASAEEDGVWSVSRDSLRECLQLDEVSFLQACYAVREGSNHLAKDSFGNEDTVFILELLESLGNTNAEGEFVAMGMFVTVKMGVDLQGLFIEHCTQKSSVHSTNNRYFDELFHMHRTFDHAFREYVATVFSLDAAIQDFSTETAHSGAYSVPPIAQRNISAYITMLFERNVLSWPQLHSRLADYFHKQYSYEEDIGLPEDIASAFKTLGFSRPTWDFDEVRYRYKSLMLRFHPDVNPNGLEQTKRINQAYAILVQYNDG